MYIPFLNYCRRGGSAVKKRVNYGGAQKKERGGKTLPCRSLQDISAGFGKNEISFRIRDEQHIPIFTLNAGETVDFIRIQNRQTCS